MYSDKSVSWLSGIANSLVLKLELADAEERTLAGVYILPNPGGNTLEKCGILGHKAVNFLISVRTQDNENCQFGAVWLNHTRVCPSIYTMTLAR